MDTSPCGTHTRPCGRAGWLGQAFLSAEWPLRWHLATVACHCCFHDWKNELPDSLDTLSQHWLKTFSPCSCLFLCGAWFSMFQVICCLVFSSPSQQSFFFPSIISLGAIRLKEPLAPMETTHQHASPRKWYKLLNSQRLQIGLKLGLWKTWFWMMKQAIVAFSSPQQ